MKILAINGSYRGSKGYTAFLINKVFEGAMAEGAECEVIHLAEKHIERCRGCFVCQSERKLMHCIYEDKDDAKLIFEKMREADLLIYATPVYVFNQSSLMNKLFDRYLGICNSKEFQFTDSGLFFHHIDREVSCKPFVTIICQDNLETETHKNILSYYKTYSRFMNAPYVGKLIRRSGGVAEHGKASGVEAFPILNKIYDSFVESGKELVLKGRISNYTQKMANKQLIKLPPMIHLLMRIPKFREKAVIKIKDLM